MKICICQYDIEWENKHKNKEKILGLISKIEDADLIILPETCLTGFSFKKEITTLTKDDLKFFSQIAKDKKSCVCFGGIFDEKNCCFVVSPEGEIILKTAKVHLFTPSGEHAHHKAGTHIKTVRIDCTNITPLICYDLRFAPLFWISAEKTDVFVVIANWPESRRNHWKSLIVARAIENQAFVVGVNRTGKSPKEKYCGDSCVIDPQGRIILNAGNKNGAFVVDLEINDVKKTRKNFPVLKDRKNLSDYVNMT
ncbi:MAG: carbon-nitrogen family hydrolase [Candidatus Omnitrophica bacterium]|nr:carbon-nitrogen family hydrolase [Candidatus Omnitrophota bacterium]